jgi:hypothetical protein
MKSVQQSILAFAFLVGMFGVAFSEVQEHDSLQEQRVEDQIQGEQVEDQVIISHLKENEKTWFDRYVKGFFVTDSKLRTAFRCMLPFIAEHFNYLLIKSCIREVNVIRDNINTLVVDDLGPLLRDTLIFLSMNAIFADFYFAAIAVDSSETK